MIAFGAIECQKLQHGSIGISSYHRLAVAELCSHFSSVASPFEQRGMESQQREVALGPHRGNHATAHQ